MATSKKAMMKVRMAAKLNKKLPEGMAIDRDGKPTIDPKEAMDGALLPFGEYKGSHLALIIELLTKTMFRVDMKKGTRGFLFIFFNPKTFTNLNEFKTDVSKLVKKIKKSRKAKGIEEIIIPGEKEYNLMKKNLKKDYLEIDEKIIKEIRRV